MNLPAYPVGPSGAPSTVVAAIFPDQASAEAAIDALRAAGFTGENIGVAMRDNANVDALAEAGALAADTQTKAVEGAVSGAVGGGLVGVAAGFVVGLIAAVALPGIGPIVAGGALAAALGAASGTAVAGAGLGAAAGGLVGALNTLGLPETDAQHFETSFRAGGVLLTVNAGPRAGEALGLLARFGGDPGPTQALAATGRPLSGPA